MTDSFNPREYQKRKQRYFKLTLAFSLIICFLVSFAVVGMLNLTAINNVEQAKAMQVNSGVKGIHEEKFEQNLILSKTHFNPLQKAKITDSQSFLSVSIPAKMFVTETELELDIKQELISQEQQKVQNVLSNYPKYNLFIPYFYSFEINSLNRNLNPKEVQNPVLDFKICLNLEKLGLLSESEIKLASQEKPVNFLENGSRCIETKHLENILLVYK